MSATIEKMELHPLCKLFPQATDREIQDMSDDIASNGLKDDIITLDDKVLDGRNRWLACQMAKVEPRYRAFEDLENAGNPLQYVISKNLHRRHLSESQRALLARDVYEMCRNTDGVPKQTLDEVAEHFRVGKTTVKEAGLVKECASESVQQDVREGKVTLNAAASAVKEVAKRTGVKVTRSTSDADKKKAYAAQERVMKGETTPEQVPKQKSPGHEFNERVMSGEFNGKKWKRNIAEIQNIISQIGRLPALYNNCYDLIGRLEQEGMLNTLCIVLADACKKVESRVQRNDTTDFTEVIKIFTDIVKKHFPDIEDVGSGKKELNEHLKQKWITSCQKCIKEAEKISRKLSTKHDQSEHEDIGASDTTKVNDDTDSGVTEDGEENAETDEVIRASPSELAEYIRELLTTTNSTFSFEEDILHNFDGDRVLASEFLREYGFEVVHGKLRIATASCE